MDVLVIGGGVIGCSVALELARGGADVRVLEMRAPGQGATQATGGMLAPWIEGHQDALLRLGIHSLALYDEYISALAAEAAQPIEYRRTGTLQVSTSAPGAAALLELATTLASSGVAHQLLHGPAARTREPRLSPDVNQGLLVPTHGYVRIGDLMGALRLALDARGVRVIAGQATRLEETSGGVQVTTTTELLTADVAVVANGSWAGLLTLQPAARGSATQPLPVRPLPVRPIRGQILEFRFPSPPLAQVTWGEDCYLIPWRDGSVLLGATVEDAGFDETPTEEATADLIARGSRVLPAFASTPVQAVRVGLRPGTADEIPLIGPLAAAPRICVATGHYRNGVLLAPITARLVAGQLLGRHDPSLDWAARAVTPARVGL